MEHSQQESTEKDLAKQKQSQDTSGEPTLTQDYTSITGDTFRHLPAHQRSAAALHVQRTQGNAYLQRMLSTSNPPIQREAQWEREMRQEGTVIELPFQPFNWDAAAPIEVNQLEPFSDQLVFQDVRFARHLGEPYINNTAIPHMRGKQNAFRTDWTTLQTSWNQVKNGAAGMNIQGLAAPQGGQQGGATPPLRTTDTGTESHQPRGASGPTVGSLFQDNPNSSAAQLAMTSAVDPERLPVGSATRDRYYTLRGAAHAASNKTREEVIAVDTALSGIRSAALLVDINKLKVTAAEQGEQSAGLSVQQQQITAERDRIAVALSLIKDATSLGFAALPGIASAASALGGGGSAGAGGPTLEGFESNRLPGTGSGSSASSGSGGARPGSSSGAPIAGGVISMASTLILEQYNSRLRTIDAQMREIAQRVAAITTQVAVLEFERSLEGVRTARNAYHQALLKLSTAAVAEEEAYRLFADFLQQNGRAMGLSQQDVATATSAAAALPLIEDTIRQYSRLIAGVNLPRYSDDSGIGINMAPTNLGTFVLRLAQLKGYKQVLERSKADWEGRRAAVRQATGMPGAVDAE